MKMTTHLRLAALFGALCLSNCVLAEGNPDQAGLDLFEKKIRPVLADKCYKCHSSSAEKIKGGLLLDTKEGARRGGDNGPAVVPGKLDDSLLIQAIRYDNKDFAMPPKKSGGKLPDDVIKDFEKWVALGAPDPRVPCPSGAKVTSTKKLSDWGAAKDWWAWRPPQAEKAPVPSDSGWAKTEIDKYLLSAMEAKGVHPVADADKLTLMRRVYFDLVGLPPPTQELRAYYEDKAPDAYEKMVDRLLASPEFGERWGRHWLDVARYAESCGKDANISFPHAWRYRNYVIDSFNQDKPYDQFIKEQLAGDLMPAKSDKEKADRIVATGFLAMGPKGLNEQNPRQFALDEVDEQIDATSQAFMGMTVACARCHDHKFDPIPQQEYYSLAGIFLSTQTKYGTSQGLQNRHPGDLVELPKGAQAPVLNKTLSASDRQRLEENLAQTQQELRGLFTDRSSQSKADGKGGALLALQGQNQLRALALVTRSGLMDAQLKNFDSEGHMKALAMGVNDLPAASPGGGGGFGFFGGGGFRPGMMQQQGGRYRMPRPPEFSSIGDSALYTRGDADKASDKVPRGFISILSPSTPPAIPKNQSGRLQLAEWIASPGNPLTSRVMVNRVWHWIFGEGIVTTPDNFGTTGNLPSNQPLLDTLAVQFAEKGWSVKQLIREIVLSHAYQLSSTYDEKNFALDPENTLVWRMTKRRLDAECIRDSILATSGDLKRLTSPYIGSVIAYAGDGPVGSQRMIGVSEEAVVDAGAHSNLRSVYLPIARDLLPDALAVFDFAEPSLVSGDRDHTNVPSQALYLLNSEFVANASKKFAQRVLAAFPAGPNAALAANLQQRVTAAYWMAFTRGPSASELKAATDFFTRFPGSWKKGDAGAVTTHSPEAIAAAWTSYCRALFATAEFRYLN